MKARRALGPIHATAVVVGAIIGVGIFITPAKVAAVAGSPGAALALWALGGFLALAGALSMAEIGARFPVSGGEIIGLHRMLGPLPAFLFGWCLLTAIQTGVLVVISLFGARNLGVALGMEWNEGTVAAVASAAIVLLLGANLRGVRDGAWIQTLTTALKLLTLALLAGAGIWVLLAAPHPSAASSAVAVPVPPPPDSGGVPWLAGLAAVLFSYGGFHQVTWLGDEVRNPRRTVPRAVVGGVLIVIVAYLAANAAYFSLLPFERVSHSSTVAADAMEGFLPGWGRRLTGLALCLSAYGVANANLLTAPRVYYALAREGLFPQRLGRLGKASGVPRAAILLQGALALLLLWVAGGKRMNALVNGVVFVDWIFHALACAGLILVCRRETRAGSHPSALPYRTPWMPWPPLLFIFGTVTALGATFLDPEVARSSLLGLAWVAAGVLIDRWLRPRPAPSAPGPPPAPPG